MNRNPNDLNRLRDDLPPRSARQGRRRGGGPVARGFDRLERRTMLAASLDPSFGIAGTLSLASRFVDVHAADVAVQPDGKVVVVGTARLSTSSSDIVVVRYNPDGTPDRSFGGDGVVAFDFTGDGDDAAAVAIDGAGRIVVAGTSSPGNNEMFAVARLRPDGSLDPAFSGDGVATINFFTNADLDEEATDVDVDAMGRVVVVGHANSTFAAARLRDDGTPDPSFAGTNGRGTFDVGLIVDGEQIGLSSFARAVQALDDGSVVVAGSVERGNGDVDFAVLRLFDNGQRNTDFGDDGVAVVKVSTSNDLPLALAVAPADGSIFVAGAASSTSTLQQDTAVVKLTAAGLPANDFGPSNNGIVRIDFGGNRFDRATEVLLRGDALVLAGNVSVVGGGNDLFAARLTATGERDRSFGTDGLSRVAFDRNPAGGDVDDDSDGAAIDPRDGAIVLAATVEGDEPDQEIGLVRLDAQGTADPSFGEEGRRVARIPVGDSRFAGPGQTLVVGQSLLVANTVEVGGNSMFAVRRLGLDGTPDPTFGVDGLVTVDVSGTLQEEVSGLAVQSDALGGRIVLVGTIFRSNDDNDIVVVRINPADGSVVGTRVIATTAREVATGVVVDDSDRIVISGATGPTSDLVRSDFLVLRLNSDGTGGVRRTIEFDEDQGRAFASAIAFQGQDIIVAGSIGLNETDIGVARLRPDLTLDTSFGPSMGRSVFGFDDGDGTDRDGVGALAVDSQGRIVVVGVADASTSVFVGRVAVARLTPDGRTDDSFGDSGRATFGPGLASAVDFQGDTILVAGLSATDGTLLDFGVLRLNEDGSPDESFNPRGEARIPIDLVRDGADIAFGLEALDDGRILVVGVARTNLPSDLGLVSLARLVVDSTPPQVTDIVDVAPDPRRDPVDSIDVVFSEPIDADSFTVADLRLTRGGSALTLGGVTISRVEGTPATFRISGLRDLTGQPGVYVLTVDAAGVLDLSGNAGTGTATEQFTVEPPLPSRGLIGDYDGDGIADLALYSHDAVNRVARFALLLSTTGAQETREIANVDANVIPVAGDFDGDRRTDVAVVNPTAAGGISTWIIRLTSNNTIRTIPFGAAGSLDRPAPADFDGDGITDIATFRANSDLTPGAAEWFILPSMPNGAGFPTTNGAFRVAFGAGAGVDLPAPFDFDGDGKADIATFRPVSDIVPGAAQWFILPSGPNDPQFTQKLGGFPVTFGAGGNADQPAVADYNGDGRDDITAFRSTTDTPPFRWFVLPSSGPFAGFGSGFPVDFGVDGSIAAVSQYVGDGRPDLAVFDPSSGNWTIRDGVDGGSVIRQFNPLGAGAVPVLSPLFFRLRATGNIQARSSGLASAPQRAGDDSPATPTARPGRSLRDELVDGAIASLLDDRDLAP